MTKQRPPETPMRRQVERWLREQGYGDGLAGREPLYADSVYLSAHEHGRLARDRVEARAS